jgi:hypothetical protein
MVPTSLSKAFVTGVFCDIVTLVVLRHHSNLELSMTYSKCNYLNAFDNVKELLISPLPVYRRGL